MRSWRNWIASRPQALPILPNADAKDPPHEKGASLGVRLLLFVSIALLPIAAVSIFQGIERVGIDVSDVRDHLVHSARGAADREEAVLASAEQIARAFSHVAAVRHVTPQCDSILREALSGIKYFANMSRIDKSGIVVCSARRDSKGLGVADQPVFQRATRSNSLVVSEAIQSVVAKRPILAVMLPLRTAKGAFDGAFAIALDVRWFEFLVRAQTQTNGAVVFLYDTDGHVMASNNSSVAEALVARSAVRAGADPLHYGKDGDGNDWTFAVTPLHGGAILVAFAMRDTSLFGGTYLHVATDFLLPIAMIGLAWAGIWFATERQVTLWMLYLRRISAAYRGGHYSIRPQLDGAPSEFRSLGHGLADMAASIQDRDRRLRDAVDQKSVLIREIHHRVKNNLQIVMSLLSLQATQLLDPGARHALAQAQIRINALALVHRSMHEIEDQTTVDLKRLLHELSQQIAQSMRREKGCVRIEEDVISRHVSGDNVVPLVLFVAEALTNSLKYAFPTGRDGVIRLSLVAKEGGRLRLSVTDNGVGFDITTPSAGIGTRLMRTFGEQVGGVSSVQAECGKGTCVELVFDDPAGTTPC